MTLSQITALLGLDETDAVRPVPLTDEDIAAATRAPATPNRAQRRAADRQHRRKRTLGGRR